MKDPKPKKERKLTAQEQARKVQFERLCGEMERQGYHRADLTAGLVEGNLMALVLMLPFVLVLGLVYFALHPWARDPMIESSLFYLWLLAALLALAAVHELIHGLTWGLFAKRGFGAISFGIIWSMLTPYCTCSEPLTRRQYLLGSAMPTLVLGFGLAAVATAVGNLFLFLVAELMILAGGGDAYIIFKLLRYRPQGAEVLYCDHPYELGLAAFEK